MIHGCFIGKFRGHSSGVKCNGNALVCRILLDNVISQTLCCLADNINILRLEGVDTSGIDEILSRLGIAEKKNKKVNENGSGLRMNKKVGYLFVW